MVSSGNKGVLKPVKVNKGKNQRHKLAPVSRSSLPDTEIDIQDIEEDQSTDEDDDVISEDAMRRLMELVGPEDLDDFEKVQLGEDVYEKDSSEEPDAIENGGEEGEGGTAEDELAPGDHEKIVGTDPNAMIDDDFILIAEADRGSLAVDELDSNISVDEDVAPQRKVTTNNKHAMRILTEGIRVTDLPWMEHLILQSKLAIDVNPEDDLQREMAFYKLALDVVPQARKLATQYNILFSRPNDYYAEMVKTDEHMERVRTKLVEESQGIKKSEEAKKQRELKKFGKQIQIEKLKTREADKKSFQDRMQGVKRKRKDGMELGNEDDEFGIQVDDAIEGREERNAHRGGAGGPGRPKVPRHVRDAKYSLGGSSRRAKQNTRESTDDFAGWGGKGGDRAKGGRGGTGGKAGVKRPGKSRRHA